MKTGIITGAESTLVLGGTGKTGRRVAARLAARGVATRVASRSADPGFDWHDPAGWDAWLLNYLFDTVLDGRNARICDGAERALGRPPVDFAEFARRSAASGAWDTVSGGETEVAA